MNTDALRAALELARDTFLRYESLHRAKADANKALAARMSAALSEQPVPIDMVLFCPACGKQHIDAPERGPLLFDQMQDAAKVWTNPPHRSHLCAGCGYIWRPADVPTNGVAAIKTKGKNDSPISAHAAPAQVVMSVTDDMVSRFLSWPLPRDFHPDCGISFDGRRDDEWNKSKTWPIGTNLLTAIQARQMLEHVLTEPVAAPHVKTTAEMRYDAAHDTSCVGAFARARPGKV